MSIDGYGDEGERPRLWDIDEEERELKEVSVV